uniref:Uncharacterized protein n=1 Tax=Trypanosoma vivax (strain Y486) TaxID=1055687 RepID=G0U2H5_TRYVY
MRAATQKLQCSTARLTVFRVVLFGTAAKQPTAVPCKTRPPPRLSDRKIQSPDGGRALKGAHDTLLALPSSCVLPKTKSHQSTSPNPFLPRPASQGPFLCGYVLPLLTPVQFSPSTSNKAVPHDRHRPQTWSPIHPVSCCRCLSVLKPLVHSPVKRKKRSCSTALRACKPSHAFLTRPPTRRGPAPAHATVHTFARQRSCVPPSLPLFSSATRFRQSGAPFLLHSLLPRSGFPSRPIASAATVAKPPCRSPPAEQLYFPSLVPFKELVPFPLSGHLFSPLVFPFTHFLLWCLARPQIPAPPGRLCNKTTCLLSAFTTALKAARNVWLAKQAAKEKEECVNETGGTGNTTPGEQDGRPDDHIAIAPTQGQWNTGTSKRSVVEAERELSERRMQLELAQQKVRTLLTTLLHYKSRVATTSSTTEDV